MTLHFKFRVDVPVARRTELRRALEEHGVGSVEQLFPGDEDEELGSIYVVEAPDQTLEDAAAVLLREAKEVDYVEPVVRRKLID